MKRRRAQTEAVFLALGFTGLMGLASACATMSMPTAKYDHYSFPKKDAFKTEPDRPYIPMGLVRTKVNWPSIMTAENDEKALCQNFYNKAVRDLVKMSRDHGGNGVADLHSVVFLYDGRREVYPTPECSDDGEEGQILLQGIAVKWVSAEEARKAKEARDAARQAAEVKKAAEAAVVPKPTYTPGKSQFYEPDNDPASSTYVAPPQPTPMSNPGTGAVPANGAGNGAMNGAAGGASTPPSADVPGSAPAAGPGH